MRKLKLQMQTSVEGFVAGPNGEMETTEEYKDYFQETWPKALEKVKALAEKG